MKNRSICRDRHIESGTGPDPLPRGRQRQLRHGGPVAWKSRGPDRGPLHGVPFCMKCDACFARGIRPCRCDAAARRVQGRCRATIHLQWVRCNENIAAECASIFGNVGRSSCIFGGNCNRGRTRTGASGCRRKGREGSRETSGSSTGARFDGTPALRRRSSATRWTRRASTSARALCRRLKSQVFDGVDENRKGAGPDPPHVTGALREGSPSAEECWRA